MQTETNKRKRSKTRVWLTVMITLAVIVGEISLVVLTTIAQEVLFHGISYRQSPVFDLLGGGLTTILASIISGLLASLVISHHKIVPIGISTLVIIETSALICLNKTTDPVWFDISAGLALIVGLWAGYEWGSNLGWRKVKP